MGASLYRKKPVTVYAMQFDGGNWEAVTDWAGNAVEFMGYAPNGDAVLRIATLEGMMTPRAGDYIIQGVGGEFYPCKPGIFVATYEPVIDENPFLTDEQKSTLDAVIDRWTETGKTG